MSDFKPTFHLYSVEEINQTCRELYEIGKTYLPEYSWEFLLEKIKKNDGNVTYNKLSNHVNAMSRHLHIINDSTYVESKKCVIAYIYFYLSQKVLWAATPSFLSHLSRKVFFLKTRYNIDFSPFLATIPGDLPSIKIVLDRFPELKAVSERDAKTQDESMQCVACRDNMKCMTFTDCGHLSLCMKCSHSVEKCPLCRAGGKKLRIYI